MTPQQHILHMLEHGHSTSAAVRSLAHIILTTERTAWRIYTGEHGFGTAAPLLLDIWHNCPAARPLWQHHATTDHPTPINQQQQPTQQP